MAGNFNVVLKDLYGKQEKKIEKIHNDVENAEVRRYERNIRTGEDAISFFAKVCTPQPPTP